MSRDRTVKVYDVVNFDMMVMLRLSFVPGTAEWAFKVWARQCTRLAPSPCPPPPPKRHR